MSGITKLKKIARRVINVVKGEPKPGPLNYAFEHSVKGQYSAIGRGSYIYKSEIGDFTYLSINVAIMNCVIGKFCSIAQGVCIGLGDHPATGFVSTHPAFFSNLKQCGYSFTNESLFKEMGHNEIGNDVWIGVNAIILNNVHIGDGAIIGAGAVVTKDVPAYAIAVGCPARVIKYRFSEEQRNELLAFKWWDKDYKWIEENYKQFTDIDNFSNFIKADDRD